MPVAVLRKSADRRASVISVGLGRRNGKQAKPVIGENRAVRRQLVAPGIILSVGAAARRLFPLGLGRQRFADPFGIGQLGIESCRERVCQYVSISVVAVSLKTKPNIRQSIVPDLTPQN